MAFGRDIVDAIIREHSYRPITGDVLIIGHQTVNLGRNEILELMREHGVATPGVGTAGFQKWPDADAGMSAAELFKLLGAGTIRTLDADIAHDLTSPIPQHLRSCADFIVDGGALSDLFSPATAIRHYAGMLRAGGRLLAINNLSGHFDPYSIPSAVWYLDYFVVNGFADCKIYILVYPPDWPANAFCVDIDCLLDPAREVRTFLSPHEMAAVLFVEKGDDSTEQLMPIHTSTAGRLLRSKRYSLENLWQDKTQ